MNSFSDNIEFLLIEKLLKRYKFCQVYINEELFEVIHSNRFIKNKSLAYISIIEVILNIIIEDSTSNKASNKQNAEFVENSNELIKLYSTIDNYLDHDRIWILITELLKLREQKKLLIYEDLLSLRNNTYIAGIIGILSLLKEKIVLQQCDLNFLLEKLIFLLKELRIKSNVEKLNKLDYISTYIILSNIERWAKKEEGIIIPCKERIDKWFDELRDKNINLLGNEILDLLFPAVAKEKGRYNLYDFYFVYDNYAQAYNIGVKDFFDNLINRHRR